MKIRDGPPVPLHVFHFMPRVGVEPTHKRFLRPPPLPLGYRGLSNDGANALSRIRTCTAVLLGHGPLPNWATRALEASEIFRWTPVGVEPTFPGCRPGVLPLDDGPVGACGCQRTLREGVEPSASAFGGPRSDPVELPQLVPLHRTGIEPAQLRLKGGGSAVELPVLLRVHPAHAPGGIRTPSRPFRRRLL